MRVACPSGVPGTWLPQVHAVCPHNEVSALVMRILAPLPKSVFGPVGYAVVKEFRLLCRIARFYGGVKWSNLQTAMSYSGALRGRYIEAERSLRLDGPVTSRDTVIRPFLKAEKLDFRYKEAKPRMIFPRSPRYNLCLASRLKPFEHWLWGFLTARRLGLSGVGRVVAKGLNQRQRANLIVRKFNAFRDGVCFEVDGKAWEAHVGPGLLEEEHRVYRSAFPGDRELGTLLECQLTLRGKLSCGAKFSRDGGRASGDFNTGMGNTMAMLSVVLAAIRRVRVAFDVLVDGDNALVFLEASSYQRVVRGFAAHVLANSGHELQLERPASVIEEIRFGQSAPVFLGPRYGWVMVRDWRKVLSGFGASHRWLREPNFAHRWLVGVAKCELSLALGVPILQEWALKLLERLGSARGVQADVYSDYFVNGAWFADSGNARRVGADTRESFCRAFGVTPEEQLALEKSFERRVGAVDRPYVEVDPSTGLSDDVLFESHLACRVPV